MKPPLVSATIGIVAVLFQLGALAFQCTVYLQQKKVFHIQTGVIQGQGQTISEQDAAFLRLTKAYDERVAAADALESALREEIAVRDRLISQLRGGR